MWHIAAFRVVVLSTIMVVTHDGDTLMKRLKEGDEKAREDAADRICMLAMENPDGLKKWVLEIAEGIDGRRKETDATLCIALQLIGKERLIHEKRIIPILLRRLADPSTEGTMRDDIVRILETFDDEPVTVAVELLKKERSARRRIELYWFLVNYGRKKETVLAVLQGKLMRVANLEFAEQLDVARALLRMEPENEDAHRCLVEIVNAAPQRKLRLKAAMQLAESSATKENKKAALPLMREELRATIQSKVPPKDNRSQILDIVLAIGGLGPIGAEFAPGVEALLRKTVDAGSVYDAFLCALSLLKINQGNQKAVRFIELHREEVKGFILQIDPFNRAGFVSCLEFCDPAWSIPFLENLLVKEKLENTRQAIRRVLESNRKKETKGKPKR